MKRPRRRSFFLLVDKDVDKYADSEIKKVYEQKIGNSAEIDLALISALEAAGLVVQPVLLSTRSNGIPDRNIPQRRDFNYVIAKATLGGKEYLIDATDPSLDLGMILFHCQNGQGLLFDPTGTFINLNTGRRNKTAVKINLSVAQDGRVSGEVVRQYSDYAALSFIKTWYTTPIEKYLSSLQEDVKGYKISNHKVTDSKRVTSEPHLESFSVELEETEGSSRSISFFQPFVYATYGKNPFKSDRRAYPVDFGVPVDVSYFVSITLPPNYSVEDLPPSNLVALPNGGGRALINTTQNANKVTLSFVVSLAKPVYSAEEYPALKALFDKIVAYENAVIALKKNDVK